MEKQVFTVNNMTCNGCVANIRQALDADKRIQSIDIQLSKKMITVTGALSPEDTMDIIKAAGYQPEVGAKKKGLLSNLFSG